MSYQDVNPAATSGSSTEADSSNITQDHNHPVDTLLHSSQIPGPRNVFASPSTTYFLPPRLSFSSSREGAPAVTTRPRRGSSERDSSSIVDVNGWGGRRRRASHGHATSTGVDLGIGLSWTRAGILRPGPHNHNSLTTTTGEESASGTTPEFSSTSASPAVVSLAYNINASRSQFQQITDRRDNHSTSSLSISNVPNPNPELFFSSTPDDIRASTVQLSMLAFLPPQPPTPLAHSNYLKPNGPASFPLQRDWSPPKPPTTGNDGVTSGDMSGAGQSSYTDPRTQFRGILNPSQIRTPVTGADLATLGGRSGVSKPYQKLAGTLRGNEAGTIHRAGSPQSHDVITGDTRETVAEPGGAQIQTQKSRDHSPHSPANSASATPRPSFIHRYSTPQSLGHASSVPSGLSLLLAKQQKHTNVDASLPTTPKSEAADQSQLECTEPHSVQPATRSSSLRPLYGSANANVHYVANEEAGVDETAPLLSLSSTPSSDAEGGGPSLFYGTPSQTSNQRPSYFSQSRQGPSILTFMTEHFPWRRSDHTKQAQSDVDQDTLPFVSTTSDVGGHDENGAYPEGKSPISVRFSSWVANSGRAALRQISSKHFARDVANTTLKSIPAVLLGMLLNILDGVSYGMIMFPSNDAFPNFGGIGVSMFFVTTIISQLIYSFGGSAFAGANGSMMIEVVPFFHILAAKITTELGEENSVQIISTTIAAFALSSILTGLTFFLLGYLKLGVLIGFFPRHILVGCIGGVGVFLIQTGLAVCTRMDDDEFSYTLSTLKFFFSSGKIIAMWMPALGLAILLRVITHRFHHQLIFPVYFLLIPVLFYIVVLSAGIPISTLRFEGWVFDMGTPSPVSGSVSDASAPWYAFYSYYSWHNTSLRALWVTMPTQFALLFFNILHPPLNVPALAVSLNEDISTNKELVAHGFSNLFAGALGTVPNYLVYVNTLLFYRVGGTTRLSGFLLAVATFALLVIGTAPIGFIPIMLVGALIFVLGIDLVKEALWDTHKRVSQTEYLTIISIMVCMSLWDFVVGVLFGIVICCFFFVVQNSRRRSVRALFTGQAAMSAVRRPTAHRDYIREVAKETVVLRLQGFLFFGTIAQVENTVRDLVSPPSSNHSQLKPRIRFLVIDLSLVAGVDMSSAEAFVRIQRLLCASDVIMVLCGFEMEGSIANALRSVDLLNEDGVELFRTFNEAMEWTENVYLRAWFLSQKKEADSNVQEDANQRPLSPRQLTLSTEAQMTHDDSDAGTLNAERVYSILTRALSSYGTIPYTTSLPLLTSFTRLSCPAGTLLWAQNDPPDGIYLIESGVLRASYAQTSPSLTLPNTISNISSKATFSTNVNEVLHFEECMVGGTFAGELSALSGLPRNSQVVVEKDAVVWKLGIEEMEKLEENHPDLARQFVHLVLKVAKTDYDILLSALAARQ